MMNIRPFKFPIEITDIIRTLYGGSMCVFVFFFIKNPFLSHFEKTRKECNQCICTLHAMCYSEFRRPLFESIQESKNGQTGQTLAKPIEYQELPAMNNNNKLMCYRMV